MNFRYLLFGILLVPFFALGNIAKYPVSSINSELKKGANKVVRLSKTEVIQNDIGDSVYKVYNATTYFDMLDKEKVLTVYHSEFRDVKSLQVTLYDANGNVIRKIKKKEIRDVSATGGSTIYSDARLKAVDISYGVFPFTVEYEYEIKVTSSMQFPVWVIQDEKTGVEKSIYTVKQKKGLEFNYKIHNLEIEPQTSTDPKGYSIYVFKAENLKSFKTEPYAPNHSKSFPIGFFAPQKFNMGGHVGSNESWESFGRFYDELNAGRDVLSPTMKKKVKELTANAATRREKIEKLYQYLQSNMRYVSVQLGVGGYQTFDANYVEKNQFGDCKALTNFMKAMLKEADVEAVPALVFAGRQSPIELEADVVFPFFNHVILYAPQEDCWMECTSSINPAGFLGSFTEDRNVLLCKTKGSELVRTPKPVPENNRIERKSTFEISPIGAVIVRKKSRLMGSMAGMWLGLKSFKTDKEIEEFYIQNLPFSNPKLVNLDVRNSKKKALVEVESEIHLQRYASKAGKRIFVPIPENSNINLPPVVKERKLNFESRNAHSVLDTLVLELPKGYRLESAPKLETKLDTEFGSYSGQLIKGDNDVIYIQRTTFMSGEFPPEKYESYRQFFIDLQKTMQNKKVVLVRNETVNRP